MKTKKKNIGDVGIRLKPIKHNLLENYTKIIKKRKKKTKKIKRKRKKIESTKSIEIHEKRDPFLDIINKPDKKEDEKKDKPEKDKTDKPEKDKDKTDKDKDKADKDKSEKEKKDKPEEPEFKKIKVQEGKRDISEKDPNIKSLSITVSTEPDKKKKGHSIKLE